MPRGQQAAVNTRSPRIDGRVASGHVDHDRELVGSAELRDRASKLRVPETYATWADVLHVAVGSVPRLVPGQVGSADLAEGATILGLWA